MLKWCVEPSEIVWLYSISRRATNPSFDLSLSEGTNVPVARSDPVNFTVDLSSAVCCAVWTQVVYIVVLQGSGGQPTASCLLQPSTSKCWRILWMCSTEMERFWWRNCPAMWMGQNLMSLLTWPYVLWTTWVVSFCIRCRPEEERILDVVSWGGGGPRNCG